METINTRATNSNREIRIAPAARRMAQEGGIDFTTIAGSGPGGLILVRDVSDLMTRISTGEKVIKETIRVSGLAGKLAEKRGVDLKDIEGTGRRGKIMKVDVERATAKAVSKGETVEEKGDFFGKTIPMTQIRKVIAKRMVQSAFTAPHIYFFTDVEMDRLHHLREEILLDFEKEFGIRISVNDFLIKAVAMAIREFPMLNAMVKGEEIHIHPNINVGLAVAMEEGLIVPALPQADRMGLGRIAQMRSDLVERARAGGLKLEEIERGTFTISSLAQSEITFFTAILNPPQSGILSVGKTVDQLALKNGEVIVKKVACFGLSVDHRIIDGAVAAAFLQSVKKKMERPGYSFLDL
jgi:pyruvate dehydrogenase E2 component (dihydrolipoamide acetyltransferase)